MKSKIASGNASNRPVSAQTGFIFPIYLEIAQMARRMEELRIYLERTEPWFDRPNKPTKELGAQTQQNQIDQD